MSGSGLSEADKSPQNAKNAKGLGTSYTPARIANELTEIVSKCRQHLDDEPDAHRIICSAITYILQDETRIRFGEPLRRDAIALVHRSIVNNWGARADKLREYIRNLLATLQGEYRLPAVAAFRTIRTAIEAGVITDISKAAGNARSEELAAAAGVPIE